MARPRRSRGEEAAVAHDYSIELGFDYDSKQKDSDYDGFLEMACADGDKLSSLDQLKKDGNLTFVVYDVSEAPHAGTGTPTSLTVTFAKADDSSPADSPFSSSTLSFTTFHDRGTRGSSEFGSRPSWYAQSDPDPDNDGNANDNDNDKPTKIDFVNTGNFFVTVALDVDFPDPANPGSTITKTFGQDPRMDVDT
jgi:hypothetical protein